MPKCSELIKEVFPETLGHTPQMTQFYLEYRDGTEDIKEALEKELLRLNTYVLQEYDRQWYRYILTVTDGDDQGAVYSLDCGEVTGSFRFSGSGTVRSMSIILNGLSRQEAWPERLTDGTVIKDVLCLSAAQQSAAAGLIRSVNSNFQNANSEQSKMKINYLKGKIDNLCIRLDSLMPIYSAQPISRSAYDKLTKPKFSKGASCYDSQELSGMLYGWKNFEEELNAFCLFVKDTQEFKQIVNEAGDKFCSFPLSILEYIISYDGGPLLPDADNDLRVPPSREIEAFTLSPMELRNSFSEEDTYYQAVGKSLLRQTLVKSLIAFAKESMCHLVEADDNHEAINDYREAINSIYARLGELYNQLNAFCKVTAETFPSPEYPWYKLLMLDRGDVNCTFRQWYGDSFTALRNRVGVHVCLWLCSREFETRCIAITNNAAATNLSDGSLIWAIVS